MTSRANQNMGLMWRFYRNETDKDQIVEMCKNVYGGSDPLPRVVSILCADDRCMPLVATMGQQVVAFCNLRRFDSDDDTKDVVYVEKVRVSEALRRKGVGTALLREAMKVSESWCDSTRCIRFLSVTLPQNFAMSKIFETTGWVCTGMVEMWPSYSVRNKVMESSRNVRGRFLDALQLSEYLPHHAVATLTFWEELETSSQIWDTMRNIQSHGGYLMKLGYFAVETVTNVVRLITGDSQSDKRSAWKLKRGASPPVLLFLQRASADRLGPLPCDSLWAFVVDIVGAEACVAFAASRKDLDAFTISFDPAITKDMIKGSALLSQVDTTTFSIYESLR